jgi:hypothetical protein
VFALVVGGYQAYQTYQESRSPLFSDEVTAQLEEAGVSESAVECVAAELEEAGVDERLEGVDFGGMDSAAEDIVAGRAGLSAFDPKVQQGLEDYVAAIAACVSLRDMERLGAASTNQTFGDSPHYDALWRRCETGDFLACDLLYTHSDMGTEYEEFGRSCGSRSEPDPIGELCIFLHGDGPNLDQLHTECLDGDFAACDGLYGFSAVGSDYAQVGATCGNRIAEPTPEMSGVCFFRFGVNN